MDQSAWLTTVIFALTYVGLALGKIPGLRVDRAGIAFVGATLVLLTGVLTLEQAVSQESINYHTLMLLFGMMVVVGVLRLSGFFERVAEVALRRVRTPLGFLALTIVLSGVCSAFLINDIVCLALTPLVLYVARKLRFDPVPYLIAVATAANIGSTATITGNPQNIYIGSHSGISYARFTLRLGPVALLGLVLDFLVIAAVYQRSLTADYRAEGQAPALEAPSRTRSRLHRLLELKSGFVTLAAIVLFFMGLPLHLVALGAAALLLLDRIRPQKIYGQIDWMLLVLFIGLFIVVRAFQVHVVSTWGIDDWAARIESSVGALAGISALLSNLASNVPAVLLLEPVVSRTSEAARETSWLTLAMSSTLAGNLTVLGSVANLIVVEIARRLGTPISFWEYCRVGIPTTLLTLLVGIAWLQWVAY